MEAYNDEEKSKVYGVSEIMEKFGKYQKIQFLYTCLPAVIVTMININYVFVASDINYRCLIPECDSSESTAERPRWWPDIESVHYDARCSRPMLKTDVLQNDECTNSSFSGEIEQCTAWIYENHDTIVADLNLACQPWKSSLVGTVHSIGMLFSMIISGWMSDRLGRKPALIFCAIGGCIGQLKTFTTSYYVYIAIEFLESAISGGTYAAAMVIMIEISSKKKRILSGVLFAYAIYVGELIFACVAMTAQHWKMLIRIVYSPTIIFISYIYLLRESPRWQILKGKTEKAKKTLEIAAKMNKIRIDEEELKNMDEIKLKKKFNIEECGKIEGFKEIFISCEIIKRLLVASVCRFTASFVYLGLMISSVLLPGNKYTNVLLITIMSFPGELMALYLMNKVGRKLPLVIGFIICGALCVASGFVPKSVVWLKITLLLIGRMLISACFTGAVTYTMELFPTSARGSLLGLCAFASRAGSMLAPLTPMLITISPALPSICFGSSALIAGVLLTLTPETKDLPLMDTIRQVETTAQNARNIKKNKQGHDNFGYDSNKINSE